MAFTRDKVALVTGGASGIGFATSKELLRNGVKGLTLVDNNLEGADAANKLAEEFGSERVIFVKADVSVKDEFEEAFKKTIEVFKNIDILINNAGILNDAIWEREISINFYGTVYGCLLGIEEYIPKYKSGSEGVIINLSSIAGLGAFPNIPIYAGTKHAIIGFSRSWGVKEHYDRTKVRVLAVCPGATDTPLMQLMHGRNLGPPYEKIFVDSDATAGQSADDVGVGIIKMIEEGENGSVWLVDHAEAYEIELPNWPNVSKKMK